jgi:hypothetical protein
MKNQQLENQLKHTRPVKGQSKAKPQVSSEGTGDGRLNDMKPMIADIGRQFMALFEAWPDSWWWLGGRPTADIMEKMRYDKTRKDLFKECVRSELWSLVPPALHGHIQLSKYFQSVVRVCFSRDHRSAALNFCYLVR